MHCAAKVKGKNFHMNQTQNAPGGFAWVDIRTCIQGSPNTCDQCCTSQGPGHSVCNPHLLWPAVEPALPPDISSLTQPLFPGPESISPDVKAELTPYRRHQLSSLTKRVQSPCTDCHQWRICTNVQSTLRVAAVCSMCTYTARQPLMHF
jgi:hypothetical protein